MIAFEVRQELYASNKQAQLIRLISEPFTFPCESSRGRCLAVHRNGYLEHLYAHQCIVFDDMFAPPKILFGAVPTYILTQHSACPKFYQEDGRGIYEVATGRTVMEGPP